MGLTISAGDPRATAITDGRMTWGNFWGVDSNPTTGAQNIAGFFDRESTAVFTLVRGTSGTANLAVALSDPLVTGFARADAIGTTWSVAATPAV